jgi:uncharacterized repeat protein (TIGR01451 family)
MTAVALGTVTALLLAVVGLVLLWPVPHADAANIPESQLPAVQLQSGDGVQLLSSDESGITFRVSVPWDRLAAEPLTDNGRQFVRLSMPGWSVTQRPGEPQLPVVAVALGVPFGADLQVEAAPGAASSLALQGPVVPAATLRVEWDPATLTKGRGLLPAPIIEIDPAGDIYGSGAAYPGVLAEIADDGVVRQQRIVGLAVYPIQYQPGSKTVTIYHSLIIRIRFRPDPSAQGAALSLEPESAAYEELLRTQLLNYETARAWRQEPAGAAASAVPWTPPVPGYRMLVKQEGMYRVTYTDLVTAGVPVDDIIPSTFQVMNMGSEIAIYVAGEADDSFDAEDYLLFYGQSVASKYTADNVYWLTYGREPGLRIAGRDGTPSAGTTPASYGAELYAEQDSYYLTSPPGDEELDRFLWDYAYPPSKPSWTYSFALPFPSGDPYTATLQLRLLGLVNNAVNPDHHTQVTVNGNLVWDERWDGVVWYTPTISFPQSYLAAGTNTIVLTCPGDTGLAYDLVYIDRLKLAYSGLFTTTTDLLPFRYEVPGTWKFQVGGLSGDQVLAFDISDLNAVEQITGGMAIPAGPGFSFQFTDQITTPVDYLVMLSSELLSPEEIELDAPSYLQSVTNTADYIVLTHPDFYSEVVPLADYRAAQGLRVALIDVQDVYDEFGYGLTGTMPIHGFLDYALDHWQPPVPSYVVLVGDGNYDPKNNLGLNRTSFFPPYLAPIDPWITETAADNRYVTLTEGDNMPDMMLGRLPVNSAAQTRTVVSKTVAYEQNPPPRDWNRRLMFVADNADGAGDFAAASDRIIDCCAPAPYEPERIYYLITHLTPAEVRQAIIDGINDGRLIVNYIGHAGITFWGSERFFQVSDIPYLTNGHQLPIMLPMTCYDGFYHYPYWNQDSLGETIARADGGGAVASWSPTGLGVTAAHDVLDEGFLDGLFQDGLRTAGQATMAGKFKLWALVGNHDLIDTYVLFGDPALHVNALDTDLQVAKTVELAGDVYPGDLLTYTVTFTNAGPATAFHVVLTDTLPALLVDPVVVYASPEVLTATAGITFAWTISDLLPGDAGVIRIQAMVSYTAQPGSAIINQAEITGTIPDLTATNNIVSVTTTIRGPDLIRTYLPLVVKAYP